jgi:hypothetical protein
MATNPRDFINDKLGGTETASERLKKSPGAIRMWAHRKVLPRSVWPEILSAYEGVVTLADLRALEKEEDQAA